jgi:hypothetical protein
MTKTRKITIAFIVACTFLIIAYDIWAVYSGGIPATISSVIFDYCHQYPIISVGMGILIGHFAWPVYPPKGNDK